MTVNNHYALLFALGLLQHYLSSHGYGKTVNGGIFLFAMATVVFAAIESYRLKHNVFKVLLTGVLATGSFILGIAIMLILFGKA